VVTDPDLLRRSIDGDQRAWAELVHKYRRLVYSVPLAGGLPPDGCDDVFQAVFLALVRNLTALKDGQALPKWLVTTATRESWRWARRARRNVALPEASDVTAESTSELVERLELQDRVQRGLDELGGKCERLLRMLFVSTPTPSYQDISHQLDIPLGSIGPTRNRCLTKLLTTLDPSLAEDSGNPVSRSRAPTPLKSSLEVPERMHDQ
jgi:RNA polymerase sigma factor (sigma-70 family)